MDTFRNAEKVNSNSRGCSICTTDTITLNVLNVNSVMIIRRSLPHTLQTMCFFFFFFFPLSSSCVMAPNSQDAHYRPLALLQVSPLKKQKTLWYHCMYKCFVCFFNFLSSSSIIRRCTSVVMYTCMSSCLRCCFECFLLGGIWHMHGIPIINWPGLSPFSYVHMK